LIQHAGFISVNTSGNTIDANTVLLIKDADEAFDAATCIGCSACVAVVKLISNVILLQKVSQYALLPQGRIEATAIIKYGTQMDAEGFGN
jgi:succinate dehydrogenase / fumarate reductase iron-sulfur subunit